MDSIKEEPISDWITQLRLGDPRAADHLWHCYFHRIARLARRHLGAAPRRVADEEDIAISVFDAVCRGSREGRFQQLRTRKDLWHLFIAIVAHKTIDQLRRENRKKRGGRSVRGHSVFHDAAHKESGDFDRMSDREQSPSCFNMLKEQRHRLLAVLRNDTLRRVALGRLEGYSNREIAQRLGLSVRSVERKLRLIRDDWSRELFRNYRGK